MSEIKGSYETNRIPLGEQLPLRVPFNVILDLSEVCNFRCSYCFRASKCADFGFATKNELMTMKTLEMALEQLKAFPDKIKLISLAGQGEPFANPLFVKIARLVRDSGISDKIDVHTNASFFNDMNIKEIAYCGLQKIVISLQGLSTEKYKEICGVNIDFARLVSNIGLLYEQKPDYLKIHIKIADVALDQTEPECDRERFYSLFSDKCDSMQVETVVPLWENLRRENSRQEASCGNAENKYGLSGIHTDYCSLVFYKIFIAPDGGIYPCTNIPSPFSLGNIYDISIAEAWNSEKRIHFLTEHLERTRFGYNETCKSCYIPINTITSDLDKIDQNKETILSKLRSAYVKQD